MIESFSELFEESLKNTEMRAGEVVLGKVVHVGSDNVIVSAGLKSEAEIPISQFRNMRGEYSVKVGDEVEVEIEAVEDGSGRTRLSHEKACRARTWKQIENAFAEGALITGVMTNRVKGGFSVMIQTVRGFLPGSLYGARFSPDDETFEFEKEPVEFKVIKLDRARNNVVVSRKAVLEEENAEEREALLARLEVDQVVKGYVKNLTDYGAFINLGGVDGLLHITDIAWKRIKHPSDVLTVGEELEVKVLKYERDRSRISLGLKQMTEDPWLHVDRRFKVGDRVFGKISSITDYGVFVELEESIKGLVHVTEMDWTMRNIVPSQMCQLYEEVEVMILDIDLERHRISLGMKQCKPNPWLEFAVNHEKGERLKGSIKSLTDFGMFVALGNGIDGLVHLNDLTWAGNPEEELRKYNKGDEVEIVVLMIDAERERISLGIKQVSEDPFNAFIAQHNKGSIVEGTIASVEEKGMIVNLAEGVTGFIRNAELAKNKTKEAKAQLVEGEEVKSKVLSIDRKNRNISLSIKALETDQESENIQEYGTDYEQLARTLGEKLKEKLFSSSGN